ncbi:acetyl-CoA hydrolase/transferase family protein [Anaerotignum lactatifermentans]|uniref:Acetyl-CoA hydrolase/transferase family protein n=1 Tax=Anaerotignum lactatifermentans TaxID=160404 RepID=A0ABS2GBY8_9FIRM|nr:acetyl-CoA hydrolase/transferase C-terminal domain-containing protein [Anaerotignum lactatifermentans]MBM6830445.1 acetyl-CoA hydrolase/transferase family protein [Anaerotignum lactatifermentans]MBM6878971.1 acetyl-CoA hydrolase/transferase family protein [Anaerotignum lactatifermentans]MBM6952017.1 acetyl-CoA hydrolase/transferase family protein [Anaerotignum lactatifermentans]
MSWEKIYEQRKCSAEEAVAKIQSGDRVLLSNAVGEPFPLVEAMVKNKGNYENITVSQMVTMGSGSYSWKENADVFTFEGWFISGSTRGCLKEGHGEFVPVYLHQVPTFIKNDMFHVDVMMVMVSPPDENGFVSTGLSCDYTVQGIESARTVLAEVNRQAPCVPGGTKIHVSQIDAFVETDRPLPELQIPRIGETEKKIGKYCASLVEDGSTLQIGIGAIPDAVLSELKDKKHLGIHSEMISDGVVDLFEAGVIDNTQKTLHKGKIVATFLMGTKKLYDFARNNPVMEMLPADYVNHPAIIAQNNQMVSINSCIQVDLFGQVASDMLGTHQFSGVGGQVDFVRGTAMALDGRGKSIIAMSSVVEKKDGTRISKIVPSLPEGTAVTTSRQDVDYVVTEYGIARLKGKTLLERGKALIAIAHPEFRTELEAALLLKIHKNEKK